MCCMAEAGGGAGDGGGGSAGDGIRVEVAVAGSGRRVDQVVLVVEVSSATTVAEVLRLPVVERAVAMVLPGIDLAGCGIAIHGQLVDAMDTVLGDGDRVEICRPLLMDPKEARRRRAQRSGSR